MGRRNKVKDLTVDAVEKVEKASKKKGFFGKLVGQAVVLSAIGAAVKYFTDSNSGAARRQKVLGLVGTAK